LSNQYNLYYVWAGLGEVRLNEIEVGDEGTKVKEVQAGKGACNETA
jgi:hypothetical protein